MPLHCKQGPPSKIRFSLTRPSTGQKQLEYRGMVVFQRLVRFYDNFLLLSALTGGLSIGALTFEEFHPSRTLLDKAAEGFFTSSTCSAVVAIMLAAMLSFRFEGHVSATRLDFIIAWTPLVLLDWSIVGVLLGMLAWYWQKNEGWRAGIMCTSVIALLVFSVWVAVWMWSKMVSKGGLGEEESKAFREVKLSGEERAEERREDRDKGRMRRMSTAEVVY